MRVLITGASGFLGRGVMREWLREGASVTAVSRQPRHETAHGLEWLQGEIRTVADAEALITRARANVVYHLAGLANGAPDLRLVEETLESQVVSSVCLMRALADQRPGTRLVLIGSLEEPKPGLEHQVRSPYGVAKAAVRSYARMFHQQFGVDVITATVMMAYGPGQEERKIVPHAILSRLRGIPFEPKSPDRALDWVYLDDVGRALRLAGSIPGLAGAEFDLGAGRVVPIRTVVDTITRLLGGSETVPPTPADAPPPAPSRPADTGTAARLLGWKAETSLESGLQYSIDYYRTLTQNPS